MNITIGLLYKEILVDETSLNTLVSSSDIIKIGGNVFGIDLSSYRLSDMKQTYGRIDFLLKDEDYIKLRDNKINKILNE